MVLVHARYVCTFAEPNKENTYIRRSEWHTYQRVLCITEIRYVLVGGCTS